MRSFEVLPAIDLRGGRCVRLTKGDFAREKQYGDDPVAMAQRWEAAGGARLHVVDLDGAASGSRQHGSVIGAICKALSIPVQVGGGLRDLDAIASVLDAGADRAILGTAAARDPELVATACARWPGHIAVGIDERAGKVATEGWLEEETVTSVEVAKVAEHAGATAIIYTDISRDGTGEGASIDGTMAFAAQHAVPVIVSGGVATVEDVRLSRAAFDAGANLCGIIIGRALYEGHIDLAEAVRIAAGER
ncbi:MAG: 1-(5-phosphoribosyl)-5-[(5-phosphoribosylamino)methylideneamino]imidazole-4-carboxamide isomerase [Deltaproteobacteria bacterium]